MLPDFTRLWRARIISDAKVDWRVFFMLMVPPGTPIPGEQLNMEREPARQYTGCLGCFGISCLCTDSGQGT